MTSFSQRILEGFSSLLDKVSAGDEPLSGIDADALHAELEARSTAREKGAISAPPDDELARLVGPGAAMRERRKKLAAEREGRVRGERKRQADAEKRAQDAAYRRMAEEARRQAAAAGASSRSSASGSSSSSSGPRPGAGQSSRRRPGFAGFGRSSPEIARAYRTLDLADGASFPEVKSAYRKLMRRYHPDLHTQSPKKQKAATELSVQVTQAYNLLEKHLQG